ncbi:MAG: hypothetical protein GF329_09055 [Candidatus Lokiarchaeota archaeon]|nr:hypothetical protein [Candidatus Lokiarchaeota archaeon]
MPGSSIAEFNTIITMLGMLCATVQFITGFYAFFYKKKKFLIKGNDMIFRAHRGFGGMATAFYILGLFAGLSGFLGSVIFFGNETFPPFEPTSPSYLIHVIGSFPTMVIILFKTFLSYFHKKTLYRRMKYLGPATFVSWAFTWITSAISYYLRTQSLPTHPHPHPAPLYLLPFQFAWLQILIPFIFGAIFGLLIWRKAEKIEKKKEEKK